MGTLVGGKTTAETDNQGIAVDALQQRYHAGGITLILQPGVTELHADIVYKLLLQALAGLPDFLIIYIIDSLPDALVALVAHEVLVEMLSIELLPFCSGPGGEVNTIGNESNVVLLGIIAVPDRSEHLLGYPTMKLAHTVHLLAGVAGEGGHTETLVMIIGIGTAHTNKLIPSDAQLGRIATHILAEETFVEIVVTSGNGSMDCIERRGTNKLDSLIEAQTLLDIITQTLQVAKGSMTLVAMVYIFLDA